MKKEKIPNEPGQSSKQEPDLGWTLRYKEPGREAPQGILMDNPDTMWPGHDGVQGACREGAGSLGVNRCPQSGLWSHDRPQDLGESVSAR